MDKATVLLAFGLFFLLTGQASADPDSLLIDVLSNLPVGAHLEITHTDSGRVEGTYVDLVENRLRLVPTEADWNPPPQITVPLEQIVMVRRLKSGSLKGLKSGATVGALFGGLLGVAAGAALSGMYDGKTNIDVAFLGGGLGAAVGGLAFGAVGAGFGALGDAWYTIYAAPGLRQDPPPPMWRPEPREDTTGLASVCANLGAGVAFGRYNASDRDETGWYAQLGLLSIVSPRFRIGPQVGLFDLSGSADGATPGSDKAKASSPVASCELSCTYAFGEAGWQPYLMSGTGLYIADDPYLGVSFGGGLLYRRPNATDFRIEVLDHLNLSGGRPLNPDYFVTVGAGFSFGL